MRASCCYHPNFVRKLCTSRSWWHANALVGKEFAYTAFTGKVFAGKLNAFAIAKTQYLQLLHIVQIAFVLLWPGCQICVCTNRSALYHIYT
jgi:hypothetical protein